MTNKIHAMPSGEGTARLHLSLGYQSIVRPATIKHERSHYELWAQSGEFKTARSLVRALVIAQDLASPSAVY